MGKVFKICIEVFFSLRYVIRVPNMVEKMFFGPYKKIAPRKTKMLKKWQNLIFRVNLVVMRVLSEVYIELIYFIRNISLYTATMRPINYSPNIYYYFQ